MSARLRTITACDKSAAEQFAPWRIGFVAPPVDVTDEAAFPEIALAIAHARKMRGEG